MLIIAKQERSQRKLGKRLIDQYEDNSPNYEANANFHVVTVATAVEASERDDPMLFETTFNGHVGPVGVTISPDANNQSSDKMPPA